MCVHLGRVMQTEKRATAVSKGPLRRNKQTNPESAAALLWLSASRIITKGISVV